MARAAQATASLALWLHLRRRAALAHEPGEAVSAPPGDAPLVLVHLSDRAGEPLPLAGLVRSLLARRPGLRFAFAGADLPPGLAGGLRAVHIGLPHEPQSAAQAIEALAPRALLLLGDRLPSALVSAAAGGGLPVILAEARLAAPAHRGHWRRILDRGLMGLIDRVLAPDQASATAARRLGADPARIEVTGPVTETLPPLSANEAERAALAQILRGRHVWLAACPTLPEAVAALAAHQAALHHNHRSLLILAGLPPESIPPIQAEVEARGLAAVLRSEDDDPEADDHVLIAEDSYEMGLWYRLAPVCFMGGTLFQGPALPPRHPFEPAALGSAIIHGPLPGPHAAEWGQLDGASAARLVSDTETLTRVVSDLTAPDQAATLARNAWAVSTGGAAVLRRIADTVIEAMERKP